MVPYSYTVVSGLRRVFHARYGSSCILTDEQIWDIFTEQPNADTLELMNDEEAKQVKQARENKEKGT